MAKLRRAGYEAKGDKRETVAYSRDREDKVSKIVIGISQLYRAVQVTRGGFK